MALFEKYKNQKNNQATLKAPDQLQELLDVARNLLADLSVKQQQRGQASTGNGEKTEDVESNTEKTDPTKESIDKKSVRLEFIFGTWIRIKFRSTKRN